MFNTAKSGAMKKKTIISIGIWIAVVTAVAQDTSRFFLDVTANKAAGFEQQRLNFRLYVPPTSEFIYYSAGAGTGLELRLGTPLSNRFRISAKTGYQLIYISKSQRLGDSKNQSRGLFNRTEFGVSLHYLLPVGNPEWLEAAEFSAGPEYIFPGKLRRKIDNNIQPDIHYQNTWGFHSRAAGIFRLKPEKQLSLIAAIELQLASFKPETDSEEIPSELNPLDGSGVRFHLGIRKHL